MQYCTRCVNPENIYGGITFDEEGVCNRCRGYEEYVNNFPSESERASRRQAFVDILERYRSKDGSNYDMIIPVSGGKDSLYQVHLMKKEMGFNPLLVTFNHTFNSEVGLFNLRNMVEKMGVDIIRFTPNPQLIPKLARLSMEKFGDSCWHCHCGIFTFPLRVAHQQRIPLLVSQEKYYGILSAEGGLYNKVDPQDRIFGIRAEAPEMVNEERGIYAKDLVQFQRPPQEELDEIGVRGICITDFIQWDSKEITEFLIKEYGFKTKDHDRTYDCYANAECHHCSGVHDYLRYLKVGHGRATDDVGIDIRKGLMTRQQGIDIVKEYDSRTPADLKIYLERIEMTLEDFYGIMDSKRDPDFWQKNSDGQWIPADTVMNHPGPQEAPNMAFEREVNRVDGPDDEHLIM
ncbi:MAG: N-acetyl sugar amidotransferase [bacterium]|nr:N-acetyl sugar amidotransferase [bacterium]